MELIQKENEVIAPNVNQTKKPRSEESIKRQTLTRAINELKGDAAKLAAGTGQPYVAPTKEQIAVECKKRWQQRLDRLKPKEDLSAYFD